MLHQNRGTREIKYELATTEMKSMRGHEDEGRWRKLPDTGKIYLTGATEFWREFSIFLHIDAKIHL